MKFFKKCTLTNMNKVILLLVAFVITTTAKSQVVKVIPKQKVTTIKPSKKKYLNDFIKVENTFNHSVYIAPLDGMPCLAPNTTVIAKIPNAVSDSIFTYIPNAYIKQN